MPRTESHLDFPNELENAEPAQGVQYQLTWAICVAVLLPLLASCSSRPSTPTFNEAVKQAGAVILSADLGGQTGIMPFTDFVDQSTGLCGLTSDLLAEQLFESRRMELFEESTTSTILEMQSMSAAGWAGVPSVRIGMIIQPQELLFGKVGIVDKKGLLRITVIDAETSEVLLKDSFEFEVTPDLRALSDANTGARVEPAQ